MPFIEEAKYQLMQEDLDTAKLKREEAEKELNDLQENYTHFKQKSRSISIILGIFLGIAVGISVLFANGTFATNGSSEGSDVDIAAIKTQEANRVIDSLNRLKRKAKKVGSGALNQSNIGKAKDGVLNNTKGKTIYSVQIGVLSEKKYPLLSSKVIPSIVSSGDGFFKYSLGLFSTIEEAKSLKEELINLGFEDAFIASYVNGKRQKIHP